MADETSQPPAKETDQSDGGHHSSEDGGDVVRSEGAADTATSSPLLASLLQETLRDAEREKATLDAEIREREAVERRSREEVAATRRAELQQRVEEEQRRRQNMLQVKAEQSAAIAGGDVGEMPRHEPKSWKHKLPLVLLVCGAVAFFVFYSKAIDEKDAAITEIEAVNDRVNALSQQVDAALAGDGVAAHTGAHASALIAVNQLSERLGQALADKASIETRAAELSEKIEKLQAALGVAEGASAKTAEELSTVRAELATTYEALEEATSKSRRRKRPKAGAGSGSGGASGSGAPKSKVKVSTDVFNPDIK